MFLIYIFFGSLGFFICRGIAKSYPDFIIISLGVIFSIIIVSGIGFIWPFIMIGIDHPRFNTMISNSFGQTFLWSIIFSVWGAYVGRTNSHKSTKNEKLPPKYINQKIDFEKEIEPNKANWNKESNVLEKNLYKFHFNFFDKSNAVDGKVNDSKSIIAYLRDYLTTHRLFYIRDEIKNGKIILINENIYITSDLEILNLKNGNKLFSGSSLNKFKSLTTVVKKILQDEPSFIEPNRNVFILKSDNELENYISNLNRKRNEKLVKKMQQEKLNAKRNKENEEKKNIKENESLLRKKLLDVKKLYDDGLITEEVLKKKQEEIMGLKD